MAKDYFMTHGEWRTFKQDKKRFDSLRDYRYYCRCGHSVIISKGQDRTFCDWCKHWVYKDEEEQMKYDSQIREREERMNFKKEMRKYL